MTSPQHIVANRGLPDTLRAEQGDAAIARTREFRRGLVRLVSFRALLSTRAVEGGRGANALRTNTPTIKGLPPSVGRSTIRLTGGSTVIVTRARRDVVRRFTGSQSTRSYSDKGAPDLVALYVRVADTLERSAELAEDHAQRYRDKGEQQDARSRSKPCLGTELRRPHRRSGARLTRSTRRSVEASFRSPARPGWGQV